MDDAVPSGLFDAQIIRIINYCRLYLHVTTVSELFNANGTAILSDTFECRQSTWFDPSIIITIQQRSSSRQINNRSQRLCQEWCRDNGSIAESLHLFAWITPSNQLRRRSAYLEKTSQLIIYHWIQERYWDLFSIHRTQLHFNATRTTSCIRTATCIRLDIQTISPTKLLLCSQYCKLFVLPSQLVCAKV